jgi:hypothetical protein
LASAVLDRWQHPAGYSTDALGRVLFYYALFVTVDYLAAALAFALERRENKWLLAGLFWQRFFYPPTDVLRGDQEYPGFLARRSGGLGQAGAQGYGQDRIGTG